MSYRLYVRPLPLIAESTDDPEARLFNWVLYDAGGDAQAQGSGDLRSTVEQTLSQNGLDDVLLVGLIPGDEALFCVADIPAKQSRFINQALPYAVEEQIAQDIDSVHLALGLHTQSGYRVAAVDRGRMAQWLELFSDWQHTRLDAIYPDAALLPTTEGGWSICLDGESAMMGSDRGEWLSMQSANLGMFAHTLAAPPSEDVVAEVPIVVYGTDTEFEEQAALIGELMVPGRLSVRRESLELMPLELLAHAHHHHLCRPINLCQRDFSVKNGKASPLKPWRPLIAVAAIWFVVQVAVEAGMGFYYQQQAEDLRQQAMAVYRESFPGDSRTHAGNVRRVVEGQLRMAGSDGPDVDFVTLMKYTGQQYSNVASTGSVTFNSINYSQSRGELVVDVRAESYDRLSALRNGLAGQGLDAKIGSVVNEPSGARGRLTVSGG
ncbi:MAG: type II secretion system protein GspL [Marinobacter sp.]|uniref:type II secretion system protein GspL n=1 Tax=Marinobacter sp. TaxID=50741 RepID=UPI001B7073A7|nr:type II secretion system protein GspL [Marinobacter sp.]MBQ0747268.1 type II secretion system protein GspL [Marinobacter sp.]MBQ0815698.1 type II secretion system protein GspL [Marinobacter sp.]|tara:strand:- start:226 stop:1530 length:1305 start_codon:yes stop_codon:yes gene_type:complete